MEEVSRIRKKNNLTPESSLLMLDMRGIMKVAILTVLLAARIHKCLCAEESSCDPPPSIEGASIVQPKRSDHLEGVVITYDCNFGYLTEGNGRTSQCTRNGQTLEWTEPGIVCVPKSCGVPGFVPHANRVGSRFTYPNSVSFECEEGRRLLGHRQRFCQTNGKWSGRLPSCQKITCPEPESPDHGRVTFSSLDFGSELQYECEKGYLLNRLESRFCSLDGDWSGEEPKCAEAQCQVPTAPDHGAMLGQEAKVDSIIIFTCVEGRIIRGSRTTKCLSTGQWTFPPPECIEPCKVPSISNGELGVYERNRYNRGVYYKRLTVGDTLENDLQLIFKCKRNFVPVGMTTTEIKVSCSHGEWSHDLQCKPVSCTTNPPPVPNARVGSVGTHHEGTVVYLCNRFYRKERFGNITCVFGVWQGITPVCKDTRCDVRALLNYPGLVPEAERKRHYLSGETYAPACEEAFSVNGQLTCDDGRWKGHFPPCKAAGCINPPPRIEHGFVTSYKSDHSSRATYECDLPYVLEHGGSVQCLFGVWTGVQPKCKDSRCYRRDIKFNRGVVPVPSDVTQSGKRAAVECEEGFDLKYAPPTCENGTWMEQSVSPCARKGCLIPKINYGSVTTRGFTESTWSWGRFRYERYIIHTPAKIGSLYDNRTPYFVSCKSEFSFQGIPTANHVQTACVNGRWKPEPVCLRIGAIFRPSTTAATSSTTAATSSTSSSSEERRGHPDNPEPEHDPEVMTTLLLRTTIQPSALEPEPVAANILNDSCSCTYTLRDPNVQAYAGDTLLNSGAKVQDGDIVKFYCTRYKFSRLVGAAEMMCKDCRKWQSSEFPTCVDPVEGDVIILWLQKENTLHVMPNGNLLAVPESNLSIMCSIVNGTNYAQWTIPDTAIDVGVRYTSVEVSGRHILVSTIDIVRVGPTHEGDYECGGGPRNPRRIHIAVQNSIEFCYEIEAGETVLVQYENQLKIHSKAIFRCKAAGQRMHGPNTTTCLPNGFWESEAPICKDVQCPELEETEALKISYSDHGRVGSRAIFHCFTPNLRKGPSQINCLRSGNWSGAVPVCTPPDCRVEDLFLKIPEGVVPEVDDIGAEVMRFGSVVRLACDSANLRLIGGKSVTCTKEGQWDVERTQCVPGCAPVVKPDGSNLIVEPRKEFYRFGEFSMFSCPPGHQLSSDLERVICLDDGWSESEIPECTKTS